MASHRQKVVVVGAGPVGALAALYAAVHGDDVELYELRGGRSMFAIPVCLLVQCYSKTTCSYIFVHLHILVDINVYLFRVKIYIETNDNCMSLQASSLALVVPPLLNSGLPLIPTNSSSPKISETHRPPP